MRASFSTKLPVKASAWKLLRSWPENEPLVFLGGSGTWATFALAFSEISAEEALAIKLTAPTEEFAANEPNGFGCGVVSIVSYDDAKAQFAKITQTKFLRVCSALIINQKTNEAWVSKAPHAAKQTFSIDHNAVLELLAKQTAEAKELSVSESIELEVSRNDYDYLRHVDHIQNEIKQGRYYQLNYLRYFRLSKKISRQILAALLMENGGPYSAWIELPNLSLISFSPEQFVSLDWHNGKGFLRAYPIKGTAQRYDSSSDDNASLNELLHSQKDRSELNMIVDLMRNDLLRICKSRSVIVEKNCELKSFTNVHHLLGQVRGELKEDISLKGFLQALCPAGSITGAPKEEVMSAIAEHEQRPRGFFMGCLFYLDERTKRLDSSVLIRTLVSEGREKDYEFAAGSGIVIQSKGEKELLEIAAKCLVLKSRKGRHGKNWQRSPV